MARNKSAATPKVKVVESKVDSKPEEKEEVIPTPDTKGLDAELKKLEVKPTSTEKEPIDTTTKSDKSEEPINTTALDEGAKLDVVEDVVDPDPILNWKKIGGGSFPLNGRYIKPGEKFRARQSEIPKAFRDVVSLLDAAEAGQVQTKHIPVVYTLEALEGGLYNIIDSFKKKINEAPLDRDSAFAFINSLNS